MIEGADHTELSEMLATLDMQRAQISTLIEERRLDAALKLQSHQRKRIATSCVEERRQRLNSACEIQRVYRIQQKSSEK